MERAFVRSERKARGPALRALCIAAAGLVGTMIANPLVLPRDDSIAYEEADEVMLKGVGDQAVYPAQL